jgi:hypothetical protein
VGGKIVLTATKIEREEVKHLTNSPYYFLAQCIILALQPIFYQREGTYSTVSAAYLM